MQPYSGERNGKPGHAAASPRNDLRLSIDLWRFCEHIEITEEKTSRMTYLLVRQQVEDYAVWKAAFDRDAQLRQPNGSGGGFLFQSVDNPNEVVVLLAWDDEANLRRFTQSDDLRTRMADAGVLGAPDIRYLRLVEEPPA